MNCCPKCEKIVIHSDSSARIFPNVLPLRLIWLAPLLEMIGGGASIGTSDLFTAVADVVPEENRYVNHCGSLSI